VRSGWPLEPRGGCGIVRNARQLTGSRKTEMERIELYKEFRIRAYEDWPGQWLAEAKKPFDTHPEYIATPFGHPTPEAAIALIKRMIDSPSTTIKAPKTIQ
jgi:hypothetical protein